MIGLFSGLKLFAIAGAIIAVVGYLAATRSDAIKAAAFKVENAKLHQVIQTNQKLRDTARELAAKALAEKDQLAKELQKHQENLKIQEFKLERAPESGKGTLCPLDCTLPGLP